MLPLCRNQANVHIVEMDDAVARHAACTAEAGVPPCSRRHRGRIDEARIFWQTTTFPDRIDLKNSQLAA